MPSSEDNGSVSSSSIIAKFRRREQIRRAQKTHRERRALYLKGLEAEIDTLRVKESKNLERIHHIQSVNQQLRILLKENNIPVPSHLLDSDPEYSSEEIRSLNVKETSRGLEISTPEVIPFSATTTVASHDIVNLNDAEIAVDFILCLEAVCLVAHHHHQGPDGEVGHSMQLQHMILNSPRMNQVNRIASQEPSDPAWNMLTKQLETTVGRLLVASKSLNMKGELTPVQCWDMLREWPAAASMTRPVFDRFKEALLPLVFCYGFGATVDEKAFFDLTSRTLPSS